MVPTPPPTAAIGQAVAATSTHVHIVIRHWPRQWVGPGSGGEKPVTRVAERPTPGVVPSGSTAVATATDSPPIEIDVTTTATSSAMAAATASPPEPAAPISPAGSAAPSHGRIGVLAATIPGVFAFDVEALQLRTPWWLVGQPIEVGLEAEANLAEAGAGITIGSKAFVEGGSYLGFDGRQRGLFVGGGLRF